MKTSCINCKEASIYVEFIQNHIKDSFSDFYKSCDIDLEHALTGKNYTLLSQKALKNLVESHIIKPYLLFSQNLINEINDMVCDYFQLENSKFEAVNIESGFFEYHFNNKLFVEYSRTENLAETMEKLIDKTLDIYSLSKIQRPVVKKFISPLSVGSLYIASLGLDGSFLKNNHRHELGKMLRGICKNIKLRTGNLLIKHYTKFIYEIAEFGLNDFAYEDEKAI